MTIAFHDLTIGGVYEMAHDGGTRFSRGDRVHILSKQPGSQHSASVINATNLRTGESFTVSGASWFTEPESPQGAVLPWDDQSQY